MSFLCFIKWSFTFGASIKRGYWYGIAFGATVTRATFLVTSNPFLTRQRIRFSSRSLLLFYPCDVRAHFRLIDGFPDHRAGAGRSRLERGHEDPGLFQGPPQILGPLPAVLDPSPRRCKRGRRVGRPHVSAVGGGCSGLLAWPTQRANFDGGAASA